MADQFFISPNGRLMRDVQGGPAMPVQSDVKTLDMTSTERAAALSGTYGAAVQTLVQTTPQVATKDADGGLLVAAKPIAAVAMMGDSIAALASNSAGGTTNYLARGFLPWANAFLGQPWSFEHADNFAVAGTTMDVILANQCPAFAAAHASRKYQKVFCSFGTNDSNAGTTLAVMKTQATAIFQYIRDRGSLPVHISILPRGADGAMTAAKRRNIAFNRWLNEQAQAGLIEFINLAEIFADNSTAFGNSIQAFMQTEAGNPWLHPNALGARHGGRVIANFYLARGVGIQQFPTTQQADQFDRTDNPTGVAFLAANPLMQGGTTAPTGMTTSGGTWSKVNRTLANGQVRSDPQCALAALTTHRLYDDWTKTGNWSATELQPNDELEGRATLVLTNFANISEISIELSENTGGGALNHYGLFTTESIAWTDTGTVTLYLKTPKVRVRDYAGSGNVAVFLRVNIVTASGGSGTATIQDFHMRKVN